MTVLSPPVQQSPIHPLFFLSRPALLHFPSSSLHSSSPLLCTLRPSSLFHPLSLSLPPSLLPSHSPYLSLSLLLSSPEGMSKCMVEWRREVGLALPNSISEKLELREACLSSESERWPAFYSFVSGAGASARHAETNTNP